MRFSLRPALFSVAMLSSAAQANDFDFLPNPVNPVQSDFRLIAEDVTAALDYKALGPAESTGITGIGVGGFVTYSKTQDPNAWRRLTGETVEEVGMVGAVAHKGLPGNIDLGAIYAQVPGTDARVYGGEVRVALLAGGIAEPALSVRGTYTKLTGSDDVDFDTLGGDVSLSKGFGPLTPYIGAGVVRTTAEVKGLAQFGIRKEDFNSNKLYAGLRLSLGFIELTPEVQRLGENTVYNVRLGVSF